MIDLVGARFTRWTVLKYSHQKGPHHYWHCKCECGNTGIIQQGSLGVRSFSCGCYRKKMASEANLTHGKSRTLLYDVWTRMHQRCENPNATNYKYYGGRGIKVCKRWSVFERFYEDMGAGWRKGLTIDRINNSADYKPSNCRWATMKEQSNNRRTRNSC